MLRCGLLGIAVLLSLGSADECCVPVSEAYTVDGTLYDLIDPTSPEYAAAVDECFADDLKCDRLCFAALDDPCGPSTFHECTVTSQPGGGLRVEGEYTLYCSRLVCEGPGPVCAPDSQAMPDAAGESEPDATPDPPLAPDAGVIPDADVIDASPPDAAIDAG